MKAVPIGAAFLTSTGHQMAKTAIAFVDGFNLYYSLFRSKEPGRPIAPNRLKWIDPCALAQVMLPQYGVIRAEYFTARVREKYATHGEVERQRTYLGALEASPRVVVHYGNYQVEPKWRPLAEPIEGHAHTHARVVEAREKQSDVRLACRMLVAAATREADLLVLVSNDSDFRPLLETVGSAFGVMTGVLSPAPTINAALHKSAKVAARIRRQHVEASLLPDTVVSVKGRVFQCPVEWGDN